MADKPFAMIVDDDQTFIDLYGTKLSVSGFAVEGVLGGELGLKAVLEKKPDILLLDVMMPGINGIEVLSKIKADESVKNMPVILLTSLANMTPEGIAIGGIDLRSTRKLSGVYFMKKDIDLTELVSKIKEILAKHGK